MGVDMAHKGKSMRSIKEIIRMSISGKLSNRTIGRAMKMNHKTVAKFLEVFEKLGIPWAEFDLKTEQEIEIFFKKQPTTDTRYTDLETQFPYIEKELCRVGVTLKTLWVEYGAVRLFKYGYSQFCYHYQTWCEKREVRMRMEHKAGDKMFVDFAGKKLSVTDPHTGSVNEVEVFVAILGCSQLTYAEASESQCQTDWVRLNGNAFNFFGGVTAAIVPDNLKSGVIKPCRYDPEINHMYFDFSQHYDTTILPARVRRPRDKALVENAVNLMYQRVYAKLRNEVFYTIDDLNNRIWELLDIHNGDKFQKKEGSRRAIFESVEKAELKPLPGLPFIPKNYEKGSIANNYHVHLKADDHWYSVPHRYYSSGPDKKEVLLRYTSQYVEVYIKSERIAMHERNHKRYGYTTIPEHMPSHHRHIAEWNPERFMKWAEAIGPETREMVSMILKQCGHPEQGFKSCTGVISLEKKFGKERVESACKRACGFGAYSYRSVRNILDKGIEPDQEDAEARSLPDHENIRGQEYYH
jgi:transposase